MPSRFGAVLFQILAAGLLPVLAASGEEKGQGETTAQTRPASPQTAKAERPATPQTRPAAPPEGEKPAKALRVFTNADLEKYGKRPSRPGAPPTPPGRKPAEKDEPPETARELAKEAPPEERPESATMPELDARRLDLEALESYLKSKEEWLKNPFLPPPAPPPGETLLDPALDAAQELERTRAREAETSNRLNKVRMLIRARRGGP